MERNDVVHVVLDPCAKPFFSGGGESIVGEKRNGEGLVGFRWGKIAKVEC